MEFDDFWGSRFMWFLLKPYVGISGNYSFCSRNRKTTGHIHGKLFLVTSSKGKHKALEEKTNATLKKWKRLEMSSKYFILTFVKLWIISLILPPSPCIHFLWMFFREKRQQTVLQLKCILGKRVSRQSLCITQTMTSSLWSVLPLRRICGIYQDSCVSFYLPLFCCFFQTWTPYLS